MIFLLCVFVYLMFGAAYCSYMFNLLDESESGYTDRIDPAAKFLSAVLFIFGWLPILGILLFANIRVLYRRIASKFKKEKKS